MRKIRLVGGTPRKSKAVKLTLPAKDFIWNIGQPTCPHCRAVFNVALQTDERGQYLNYDVETNEVTVQHGDAPYITCPSRGKRFRYKIPSVEVTEI